MVHWQSTTERTPVTSCSTSRPLANALPQYSYVFWGDPTQYEISHFTVFNAVPDGGSMAMMLGMALIGLGGLRRLMK